MKDFKMDDAYLSDGTDIISAMKSLKFSSNLENDIVSGDSADEENDHLLQLEIAHKRILSRLSAVTSSAEVASVYNCSNLKLQEKDIFAETKNSVLRNKSGLGDNRNNPFIDKNNNYMDGSDEDDELGDEYRSLCNFDQYYRDGRRRRRSSFFHQPKGNAWSTQLRRSGVHKDLQLCYVNAGGSDDLDDEEDGIARMRDERIDDYASLPVVTSVMAECKAADAAEAYFGLRTPETIYGSGQTRGNNQKRLLEGKGRLSGSERSRQLRQEAMDALSRVRAEVADRIRAEHGARSISPTSRAVHDTLKKVGLVEKYRVFQQKKSVSSSTNRYRLSRHLLSQFNLKQLQLVLQNFNNYVERLNEDLVKLLVERDELHMRQDSLLVDIDDLTSYLCTKEDQRSASMVIVR